MAAAKEISPFPDYEAGEEEQASSVSPISVWKGRGAVSAPTGRFDERATAAFDDGWETIAGDNAAARPPDTEVFWDAARSLISKNNSPDIPHRYSVNPYRGCEHGCVYCFARPAHSFLGLSPGLDFETKIFAKQNAAQLLRAELARPNYAPHTIALGINTDAYQPIERRLRITRGILEVLRQCRHPVSLITKSALIERDLDLIAPMAKDRLIHCAVSITSLDANLTRALEPRAASPMRRLKIVENLAAAGAPVAVLVAPLIPAVNDAEIEKILKAAANAGASAAGYVVLRLPHELKEVFSDWLGAHLPMRAAKVRSLIRQLHGGRDYNPAFGARHKGSGAYAEMLAARFRIARARLGLDKRERELRTDLFRPPQISSSPPAQSSLF
jgi:DNA repair photolyase